LRVLEERAFKRIGGIRDVLVDVRVIASTNRNLEQLIQEKKFREDLYYRLNAITIDVPPLRERREDIAPLTAHFLKQFSLEFRKELDGLSDQALQRLEAYDWPGNIRELRNVLERAALLGSGPTLTADDMILGRPSVSHNHGPRLLPLPKAGLSLSDLERDLVMQALEQAEGNQTKAAQLLGMTREKIHYRMAKYGLSGPS